MEAVLRHFSEKDNAVFFHTHLLRNIIMPYFSRTLYSKSR